MFRSAAYAILLLVGNCYWIEAASKNDASEKKVRRNPPAVLWRLPENVASRDLFFGPGSKDRQPQGPFMFVEEVKSGTNPKFEVQDAKGVVWRVKLGEEARPETAATRLVWALGYFADEAYLVPEMVVRGLKELSRGQDLVSPGGVIRAARLERKNPAQKKLGDWKWKKNPFVGTRELDGLRVLMALMNNWDLKPSNNAIYDAGVELRYLVNDLGGTFGRTGSNFTRSKGDLSDYAQSKFIKRVSGKGVDFVLDNRPFFLTAVYLPYYLDRSEMEDVGEDIPLPHVEWIAYYLNQLSQSQLEAAFRAAGYSPQEVAAFVAATQRRIGELRTIREGGPSYEAKTR
ncbi:MAG: hypothetical protein L0338_12215 [Acidobacteria bacterium]|nr:hypothetical protein [Acidobacteriota bacterium]